MVPDNFFLLEPEETKTKEGRLARCLEKYGYSVKETDFLKEAIVFSVDKDDDDYSSFYENEDEEVASLVNLMKRSFHFVMRKEESFLNALEEDPDFRNTHPLLFNFLVTDDDEDVKAAIRDFFKREINELRVLSYLDILDRYERDEAMKIIRAVKHMKEMRGLVDVDAGVHYKIGEDDLVDILEVESAAKRKHAEPKKPDREFVENWDVLKIIDFLSETIVGQDEAKTLAAEILYEHVVRIVHPEAGIKKSNYLMYGPTGVGKTEIWRQLKRISPVPILITDSSQITMQGYKGNDKEDMFLAFSAGGYNMEKGIMVLDEFDKLCQRRSTAEGENIGKVIQSELLKMIEGGDLVVDKQLFNTEAITFVCTGVFEDLFKGQEKIRKSRKKDGKKTRNIMQTLTDYGMIPELAGRISTIAALKELTLENYYDILCNSKDNCLENLQRKYRIAYGIEIHISKDAMRQVARTARSSRLGVRAMQGILERTCGSRVIEALKRGQKELKITKEMILEAEEV